MTAGTIREGSKIIFNLFNTIQWRVPIKKRRVLGNIVKLRKRRKLDCECYLW